MTQADNPAAPPSPSSSLPWGAGVPDPNMVYLIPIDLIALPTLRVTSTFTPEQTQELIDSLKTEGQKDPVKLVWAGGELILADGLNRILALKSLGASVVKGLVSIGSVKDVQIANIITARHRGKENPAQTAEVIKDLIENEHMPEKEIQQRLGLQASTFRRLLAISRLPPEVKDHIKYGRLGVMAAYHIAQIENPTQQITLATQAVNWGYTEEQVKAAVSQILNPDLDPAAQTYVFNSDGAPKPVYPKCHCCGTELQSIAEFAYFCQGCKPVVDQFITAYQSPAASPSPQDPLPSPSQV